MVSPGWSEHKPSFSQMALSPLSRGHFCGAITESNVFLLPYHLYHDLGELWIQPVAKSKSRISVVYKVLCLAVLPVTGCGALFSPLHHLLSTCFHMWTFSEFLHHVSLLSRISLINFPQTSPRSMITLFFLLLAFPVQNQNVFSLFNYHCNPLIIFILKSKWADANAFYYMLIVEKYFHHGLKSSQWFYFSQQYTNESDSHY